MTGLWLIAKATCFIDHGSQTTGVLPMDRPHSVLITTAQQRFDMAGDAAPSFMRTLHFDHLTQEGGNCSPAYGDCPVPSRIRYEP